MSTLYKEWMTSPPDSPSDIQHYGVLGMKWGVRKAQEYTNRIDFARRNAAIQRINQDQTLDAKKKRQLKKLAKQDFKKAKAMNKAGAKATREELKKQIKSGLHKDEKKQDLRNQAVASLEKEFPGFSKYADRIDAESAQRTKNAVAQALLAPLGIIRITSDPSLRTDRALATAIQTTEGFNNYINDLLSK